MILWRHGFLGSRADVLIDILVVSLVVVLAVLAYSLGRAGKGFYSTHRGLQLGIGTAVGLELLAFEVDIRLRGGWNALTAGSSLAGTGALKLVLAVHLVFAVTTVLLWGWLISASLRRFSRHDLPGGFSRRHRLWGKLAAIDMTLTCVTAVAVYIAFFIL
ncbi:MAG: DUF420 domain-containing protein [Acidobacteria bacterium]|jgi:putative membrane protein|nr:DUF420 domain-containing protein [Acidobacteriota bacterium]